MAIFDSVPKFYFYFMLVTPPPPPPQTNMGTYIVVSLAFRHPFSSPKLFLNTVLGPRQFLFLTAWFVRWHSYALSPVTTAATAPVQNHLRESVLVSPGAHMPTIFELWRMWSLITGLTLLSDTWSGDRPVVRPPFAQSQSWWPKESEVWLFPLLSSPAVCSSRHCGHTLNCWSYRTKGFHDS